MKFFVTAAFLVFCSAAFNSSAALAQAAGECTCLSAAVATPGQVANTSGSVSYAGTQGPQNVVPGTPVNLGTQISVGPIGSVGGQFGASCAWSAGPNSIVTVSQIAGGQYCLRVSEVEAGWRHNPVLDAVIFATATAIGFGVMVPSTSD